MTSHKATIAVIGGTGALGQGLARRLAAAGHPLIIGSRTVEKAREAAVRIPAPAGCERPRGATNADAAGAAQIVLVTVPWGSQAGILDEIRPHVAGKLVIDTTVPLVPPKVARAQLPPEGSAALVAQKRLGEGVRVVSAFHNVAAHKLQKDEPIDCDILVFGDDPQDRETAIRVVAAAGLRGIHAGPLANSAAAEALTSVLIGINRNYKADGAGIRITGIATS
ncbi:MAG: NADPH-dependent F420 reductase [Hyphomicrobiaceae bacterium]|nr:MAG: NADPH-dependent F420 reductase [Hyphomicrobiaceae bacterium]